MKLWDIIKYRLVQYTRDPLTGSISYQAAGRTTTEKLPTLKPILQAMASPPTITSTSGSGTSTITTPRTYLPSSSAFLYLCEPVTVSGGFAYTPTIGNTVMNVAFESDASIIEFVVQQPIGFNIKIDGELLNAAGQLFGSGSPNPVLFKLDFAGVSKARKYEFVGYNCRFGGCFVNATASVWSYPDDTPLIAVLSDSYSNGQTGAINSPAQMWAYHAAARIGCRVYSDGAGGQGYTSVGSNAPIDRFNARIAQLPIAPSVVCLALGYNDVGSLGNDMVAVGAAYDLLVPVIRAKYPSARIVTLGPWTPSGTDANLTACKNTLVSHAYANGSAFVDIEDWVSSSNSSVYSFGVHPSQSGHDYLGHRAGESFRAIGL